MSPLKTIHHHAGNTSTAQRLGFPGGCYTVEVRQTGQPLTVLDAYADHADALHRFDRVQALPCPVWLAVNNPRGKRSGPAWLND